MKALFSNPHFRGLCLSLLLILVLIPPISATTSGDWKFVVFGDSPDPATNTTTGISPELNPIAKAIAEEKPEMALYIGDLINGADLTNASPMQNNYTGQFGNWMTAVSPIHNYTAGTGIPLYVIRGNHEENLNRTDEALLDAYLTTVASGMPMNGPPGEEKLTYSFTHNGAKFIATDDYIAHNGLKETVNQSWVNGQLTQDKRPFMFVFGHSPAYLVDMDAEDLLYSLPVHPAERDTFWNSMVNNNVSAYLCGHAHVYVRAKSQGLRQIVSGNGGASMQAFDPALADPALTVEYPLQPVAQNDQKVGYLVITVHENCRTFDGIQKVYNTTTHLWEIGDTFTISTVIAPVASFTGTPTSGVAPLPVQFTDTSTGSPTGWSWFFGDETYTQVWTQQTASAGWSARVQFSSVAMPDGSIVLMGGLDNTGAFKNDTWRSADNGRTWALVNASSGWPERASFRSVVLPDSSIVLMAGISGNENITVYNDTWRSTDSGRTWTQQSASAGWSARSYPTCVGLPDGTIILMGGRDGSRTQKNDTWQSTDKGVSWTQVNASSGWSTRSAHVAVAKSDGTIFLMGGLHDTTDLNDTWQSTDKGVLWTLVNASSGWVTRQAQAAVAMPDGSIVLMGGFDQSGAYMSDTWRSTDNGVKWAQLSASSGWSGRLHPTTVAMPDGSIVLMGGAEPSTKLNDTWRFQPAGSSLQNPSHTYSSAGIYTVALTATNSAGSNSLTRTNYVTVTSPTTTSTVGVFRRGVFYLRNTNSAGNADNTFAFGAAGDTPIVGDWTGQGKDTAGVFRQDVFYLRNSNSAGNADNSFAYGTAGDTPLMGHWTTGQTGDSVGVFRSGTFYLRNTNSAGIADNTFTYGAATDVPLVGDWTGKGYDTVGVFRSGTFYLKNTNSAGIADNTFTYGAAGDIPVIWHHDGKDTVGVFRRGTFYLKNTNSAGNADNVFTYGAATDTPLKGKWI